MGRTTVYNDGLSNDYQKVSKQNQNLVKEFVSYCKAMDRAASSIGTYEAQLKIFFAWNYKENEDKFFIDMKKRDFIKFFGYIRDLGVSSSRVASFKAVLSSFSNAIEVLFEDEYPTFRNNVKTLETVIKTPVREKTVISIEQLDEMLDILMARKKYQLACYLAFLASSGCRKSETIQMKVEYFNEQHEVYSGNMYLTDKIRTKGRGKAGKVIQRYCIKATFKPYLDAWLNERKELGINNESLFLVKHGDVYEPATIATMNSFAETISNMFHFDFYNHSMRHYFVTYLKSKVKLDQETIKAIVHWQSTAMVDIYDDTSKEEGLEEKLGKQGLFK